jgi:hypothetical protein
VLTDEASVRFLGCSWTLCDVGLQAVSKSKADAHQCVLACNTSAAVLEEGAHALFESSQFLSNRVAVAARSASLHLQSSCCVFDAVALIFDKRSTAALADSSFFGGGGGAAAASDGDVQWLRGGTLRLSAAAVATALECIQHARQVQQAVREEGGTAALQVACAIKSVSSVKWCPSLSSARVASCLRCRRACAVCNASAAAALEDEAAAPGVSDTACRNVKVVKLHCPHI